MTGAPPAQLAFDPPGTDSPKVPQSPPRVVGRALPEFYRVPDAATLLRITPGALRRRAAIGAIVLERSEHGEYSVTRAELARHVAEYRPRSGGRPVTVSDETVGRIEGLRGDGWSYARIAALLTLEGVPTGHGADRWWPSSVRAILVRGAKSDREDAD